MEEEEAKVDIDLSTTVSSEASKVCIYSIIKQNIAFLKNSLIIAHKLQL